MQIHARTGCKEDARLNNWCRFPHWMNKAMLQLIDAHKIVPVIDEIFDLSDGNTAIRKMDEGKQFGKLVLKIFSMKSEAHITPGGRKHLSSG